MNDANVRDALLCQCVSRGYIPSIPYLLLQRKDVFSIIKTVQKHLDVRKDVQRVSDTPIFMQMLSERGATGGLSKWSGELRDRWSATTTTSVVADQKKPTDATPSSLLIPQGDDAIKWQRVAPEEAKPVPASAPAVEPLSRQPLGDPGSMGAGLAPQVPQDVAPTAAVIAPSPQVQQYGMPYGDVGAVTAATPTPAASYTGQPELLQETQPMPTWQPAPQGVDPQASGLNAWGTSS